MYHASQKCGAFLCDLLIFGYTVLLFVRICVNKFAQMIIKY